MRIRAEAAPHSEASFNAVLKAAFKKPHDKTLHGVLKRAYHNLVKNHKLVGVFGSRSEKETARRGRREKRQPNPLKGGAGASPALEDTPRASNGVAEQMGDGATI